MTGPSVACDQCGGPLAYRVKFEGFAAEADNFDQLVDHLPMLFTSQVWLRSVAENREGRVTVLRLPDQDDAEPVVIAYAGPHPSAPTERLWSTAIDAVAA